MQLAKGLERLRIRSGLTLEEVAKRSGYGKSTVQRYEAWRSESKPQSRTVRSIAEAAGGDPDEVAALVQLAEDVPEGWWVRGAVPEWLHPLVALEHEAEEERAFAPSIVPGLLQTREYATAIHLAEQVRKPLNEVERQVDGRMKRQSVLILQRSLS
ncbi:Scr1 family TA system antitoxin-like transcriptional regulator [Streptomyces sp. NPDC059534]|uniref:Scr1 family TA system antitoxin-like transcriptional regulator n=1 Tax=Streptomyces sp. NPDC059534 TaxID=3346859 RepID=UPI0036C61F20